MWQKPAQPSASIYRAERRVQQRPASAPARRSLSLSIRAFLLFLHPLSLTAYVVHLFSFFVLLRSGCSLPPSLHLDHRRCCQTTTCTPGPGQLPSCGHPYPSFSPALSLCAARSAGLTRPLRARTIFPSRFSSPHAVIYHRAAAAIGFFPFSSAPTPGAARRILRLLTAVRHVLLPLPTTSYCYYYPRLSFLNPFLPAYLPVRDDAMRFINFRDVNRR